MKRTLRVRAFGGLDERKSFSGDLTYASDMCNFQVTENHTLRKRGGLIVHHYASGQIMGLWSGYIRGEKCVLYVANEYLYGRFNQDSTFLKLGHIGPGKCTMFEFQRSVYIKTETSYHRFGDAGLLPVVGYVPTVAIGCAPDGSGTSFEDINMLSSERRVKYSCDGTSKVYHLPEKNIAAVTYAEVNGVSVSCQLDKASGALTFTQAPAKGVNNLVVQYDTGRDRSSVVLKSTGVMLFGGDTDGHVFLWGNPAYPGYRFHSELANGQPSAEYFPENNYTIIGDSEITDIISQYDRQLIFTKDRAYYSYCELQKDTFGNVYASFPVYNLNGEKGSLLKNAGCIMSNEPVTLCADGLNRWASTAVENEKNAVCFSGAVSKTISRFLRESSYKEIKLFNLHATGELFCICGETALVYNYRIDAWYRYDHFDAEYIAEFDGTLLITRGVHILYLAPATGCDTFWSICAYWESPYLYMTDGARKGRVHRMYYTACVSNAPEWEITYEGGAGKTELRLPAGEQKTVSGSFRVPVFDSGLIKFRLTEEDDALCEISEWQMLIGQKGQYGRKGV